MPEIFCISKTIRRFTFYSKNKIFKSTPISIISMPMPTFSFSATIFTSTIPPSYLNTVFYIAPTSIYSSLLLYLPSTPEPLSHKPGEHTSVQVTCLFSLSDLELPFVFCRVVVTEAVNSFLTAVESLPAVKVLDKAISIPAKKILLRTWSSQNQQHTLVLNHYH